MFQVKIGCELKLAADNDNANLILIWPHCHFQQNEKVSLLNLKNISDSISFFNSLHKK